MMALWSAMELIIIVGLAYMGYRLWWKGSALGLARPGHRREAARDLRGAAARLYARPSRGRPSRGGPGASTWAAPAASRRWRSASCSWSWWARWAAWVPSLRAEGYTLVPHRRRRRRRRSHAPPDVQPPPTTCGGREHRRPVRRGDDGRGRGQRDAAVERRGPLERGFTNTRHVLGGAPVPRRHIARARAGATRGCLRVWSPTRHDMDQVVAVSPRSRAATRCPPWARSGCATAPTTGTTSRSRSR